VPPPSPALPEDAAGEPLPTLPPSPATPPPSKVAANAVPHPPAPHPDAQAAPHPPAPPQPKAPPADVPVFNLGGTDSETNAIVTGDQVIPASPDDKARNRPPVYPQQAALLRQQGAVIVMIHVSPQGTTQGVDIVQGSGYALLDRAVLDAVRNWRFLPAVKDGQPVPFDMPMRFVFQAN
jgi:protein TonB